MVLEQINLKQPVLEYWWLTPVCKNVVMITIYIDPGGTWSLHWIVDCWKGRRQRLTKELTCNQDSTDLLKLTSYSFLILLIMLIMMVMIVEKGEGRGWQKSLLVTKMALTFYLPETDIILILVLQIMLMMMRVVMKKKEDLE